MAMEPYDYDPLGAHPKLLAVYSGWVGQKACSLTHAAVFWDRTDLWVQAAGEVDRLVLLVDAAKKAKLVDLSSETGALLGSLIRHYGDGGWWTSSEATRERTANEEEQAGLEDFLAGLPDQGVSPFFPRLALEEKASYVVADSVLGVVDRMLRETAVALGKLDLCRLGVLLSGLCHRLTPRLPIRVINSVLGDLASHGATDLQAENELRRAVGLVEIDVDRKPASISHPKSLPAPSPKGSDGQERGGGEGDPFDPSVEILTEHLDFILACVFKHFGLPIPPEMSDAPRHAELEGLKRTLLAQCPATTTDERAGPQPMEPAGKPQGRAELSEQTTFWANEAIEYLGLDRLDLKRPDMALQRYIKSGALRPIKIGRRNAFKKADLDRILTKGDKARRRGRPRKDAK